MANTEDCYGNPSLSRTRKLQQEVCRRIFQTRNPTYKPYEKGHQICVDREAREGILTT